MKKKKKTLGKVFEPDDLIVSQNIKYLRMKNDIPQHVVATSLGVSRTQYCNYENGIARLVAAKLNKLAKFFNLPIEKLFQPLTAAEKKTITILKN